MNEPETEGHDEELDAEQLLERQEADFEAGFNEASGEQDDTAPRSEATPPEAAPPQEEPADSESPETLIAGLKESELRALLAKASKYDELEGRVFGKFGEVQRTLNALQQRGGQRVHLTADKLKRMQQFDPEFAEAIASDLNEILDAPTGNDRPAFDAQAFQQAVEGRVSQATDQLAQQFEAKLLAMKHPDWRQAASSPDFAVWKSTLDEQTRQQVGDSWDASFLASKIDEFKAWRDRSTRKQTNQRRLEQAITPDGVARPVQAGITDDDAFLAGFNSMRGT